VSLASLCFPTKLLEKITFFFKPSGFFFFLLTTSVHDVVDPDLSSAKLRRVVYGRFYCAANSHVCLSAKTFAKMVSFFMHLFIRKACSRSTGSSSCCCQLLCCVHEGMRKQAFENGPTNTPVVHVAGGWRRRAHFVAQFLKG
jgi:hypothetical protein